MLKERQIEILDFIKRFIAENGYSPTIREISIGTNTKSVSTVQENLKKLINNGLITIDKNKSRTIELLIENEYMSQDSIISLPIKSSPNDKNNSTIDIPYFMIEKYKKENLFAYKQDKSIFIIDQSLKDKEKLSLFEDKNIYLIEKNSKRDLIGNVISEFKEY